MPHRRAAAVLRFSSLGDVLLAAHVPAFLKQVDRDRRVLFVTKERFAGLLRGHPDVDRVYALEERGSDPAAPSTGVVGKLGVLIAALRGDGVEEIFDLHQNWRSSRIVTAFPQAKHVLPPKYGLRRRLRVYARWFRPEPVPPLLRTYRGAAGLDSDAPLSPWLRNALSEAELACGSEQAPGGSSGRGFVLLGAGARWETKRWPAAHFATLARRIERELGLGVRYAVTGGERAAQELVPHLQRNETPLFLPFRELAAVAAHARAIVSNDSAVLHLGPALGVPAVGIFGGTVPEFGFARQGPRDEVAEIRLWCRPCGVHGRRRCPLGHHACMKQLHPDLVYEALGRAVGDGIQRATRPSRDAGAASRSSA